MLKFIASGGQNELVELTVAEMLESGGYILWVELPKSCDTVTLFEVLVQRGITIGPGPMFSASQRYRNCMRLSLGYLWTTRHERAMREVGRMARELAGESAVKA